MDVMRGCARAPPGVRGWITVTVSRDFTPRAAGGLSRARGVDYVSRRGASAMLKLLGPAVRPSGTGMREGWVGG